MLFSFVAYQRYESGAGRSSVPVKITGSPYSPSLAIYIRARPPTAGSYWMRFFETRERCCTPPRSITHWLHEQTSAKRTRMTRSTSDPYRFPIVLFRSECIRSSVRHYNTGANATCEYLPGQTAPVGQKAPSFVIVVTQCVSGSSRKSDSLSEI